jgi:hypothetical protein
MGAAAHEYIGQHYVGDVHLLRYERLFSTMIGAG